MVLKLKTGDCEDFYLGNQNIYVSITIYTNVNLDLRRINSKKRDVNTLNFTFSF